jgi:hypothetical protein
MLLRGFQEECGIIGITLNDYAFEQRFFTSPPVKLRAAPENRKRRSFHRNLLQQLLVVSAREPNHNYHTALESLINVWRTLEGSVLSTNVITVFSLGGTSDSNKQAG